jgi:hypothetical protein
VSRSRAGGLLADYRVTLHLLTRQVFEVEVTADGERMAHWKAEQVARSVGDWDEIAFVSAEPIRRHRRES